MEAVTSKGMEQINDRIQNKVEKLIGSREMSKKGSDG